MSYPSCIQPLVIEDEPDVKTVYEDILRRLGTAPPKFAFCYEDAIAHLKSSTIFHLVLLDLRLPESVGLPPTDTVDLGMTLLEECVKREWYPIPALLIVSGHVAKARQSELSDKVRGNFCCGRVLVKGAEPEHLAEEINKALDAVSRYIGVGIHLRDAGRSTYPVISPREEDLLRRSVLDYSRGVGIDLEWWSASRYSSPSDVDSEWTKVLMGRFLLADGDRASRTHFFKLYPAAHREATVLAARGLASRLQHVSVVTDIAGVRRSLLVTQAVGPGERRPRSLRQWLAQPSLSVEAIRSVASQVAGQLFRMGNASPNIQQVNSFIWPYHDEEQLGREWQKWKTPSADDDPLAVLRMVQASTREVRYTEHSFIHGDLHAENVAVDVGDSGDEPRAFVFDAGATTRAPRLKDMAMLEVSVLLHSEDYLTAEALDELFGGQAVAAGSSPRTTFVRALRSECLPDSDPEWLVYAVLLFDQALVQLGGLAFAVSGNKIHNPKDAARLVVCASKWLNRMLNAEAA